MKRVKAIRYTGTGDSISAAKAVLNCWLADEWSDAMKVEYERLKGIAGISWREVNTTVPLSAQWREAWRDYRVAAKTANEFYDRNLA